MGLCDSGLGICGLDPDDVFAFTTEKRVRVRHRWLGFFYYSLLLSIGLYVVAYQILYQRQYIKRDPLHAGAVSARLLTTADPRPVASMGYCRQAGHQFAGALPCVLAAEADMTVTDGNMMLVATRISRTRQRRDPTCGDLEYGCVPWLDALSGSGMRSDAFVGDVESSTLLLQHDISARASRPTERHSTSRACAARPERRVTTALRACKKAA